MTNQELFNSIKKNAAYFSEEDILSYVAFDSYGEYARVTRLIGVMLYILNTLTLAGKSSVKKFQ